MSYDINLEYLCFNVRDIARLAGREILRIYAENYEVTRKEDNTPVTTADYAAHDVIVNNLAELTPEIPVLSEESEKIPYRIRETWTRYWLIDPLDGTREFIKRNGEFSVNIALIDNHRSILGVIYAPVLRDEYFAWQDGGAFKQHQNEPQQSIQCRKVNHRITVAGSRSHGTVRYLQFVENLGDCEILAMGSSIKSCLVAEGAADVYPRLGATSEWDTAAAQCIVEEAGGYMQTLDGLPLRYNTRDSLTNPEFLVYGDDSVNWQTYI